MFSSTGCILWIIFKKVCSRCAQLLLHPLPYLLEGEQERGGLLGDRAIPNKTNEPTLTMLIGLADGHELHWGKEEDCVICAPLLDEQVGKFLEASCGLLKHLNF
jgi:hypothetical protein